VNGLKQAIAEGRHVTVPLLAKCVGASPGALYAAIREGEVRAVRIGNAVRIPAHEARRLLGLETEGA
jgi:excisionase family DNA binding protein